MIKSEIWPQPGQPVQSVESFPEFPIFRCLYDLGGTFIRSFRRYIDHTLLGKTGPNNVSGKIAEIEGRIDDAIGYYTDTLRLDTYDEESLIGRGSCYTVKKNHEGVVADFKKVLDLSPCLRIFHLFAGTAFR